MFFPLVHTCSIIRSTLDLARSGEETHNYDYANPTYTNVTCLWYPTSGKRNLTNIVQFGVQGELYLEPKTDIQEEDYITNLVYEDGTLIDAGPLMVDFVRRISDLSGNAHHITCKLTGVAKGVTSPPGVNRNQQRGYIA